MTVSQHSTINHSNYNAIQSAVAGVYSSYGINPQSFPLTQSTLITNHQWSLLETDIALINKHQNGTDLSFNRSNPVTALYVNNMSDTILSGRTGSNIYTLNVGQSATTTVGNNTGPASLPWIHYYTVTTTAAWASADRAGYFFNLGGSITPHISVTGNDAANWQSLVNQANATTFDHTHFFGSYLYTQTFTSGNRSITLEYTLSGSTLTIIVDFEVPPATAATVTVTSAFRILYSVGVIPATLPQVQVSDINNGGTLQGLLTYSPNPVPDFTAPVNQGAPQTIVLTNNSNENCIISSVTSTGFPFDNYQIDSTTLAPNASAILLVTYVGTQPGTHNSTIIVNSNVNNLAIAATVITKVIVVVSPPPPPTPPPPPHVPPPPPPPPPVTIQSTVINQTVSTFGVHQYPISLAVSGTSGSSYRASLDSGSTGNSSYNGIFSLVNASGTTSNNATFTVVFSTLSPSAPMPNGVYTNNITFVLSPSEPNQPPITLAIPVTITVNVISQSLGTWLSPINENNGVIGMDYSIIDGNRYLTIGFGISTGAYTYSYMPYAMKLLGNYGTNMYGSSGNVYYHQGTGAYSTFLQTYGVWFIGAQQTGTYTDTYTFRVTTAGTYTWEFSCDDTGYFTIDGTQISNVSGNYGSSATGTITLAVGIHTLVWHVTNNSSWGAVGIRITEARTNTDVWSTLATTYDYINNRYGYWSEVYRIPVGTAGTYYTNINYQTYTQFAPGQTQTYGSYFGFQNAAGSMFTVTADSSGNLGIVLNGLRAIDAINTDINTTLNEVQYLFYYYSTADERLNNLADPVNGSQTQYFTGFSSSGAVKTILLNYPTGNLGVGWCSFNNGNCGCIGGGGGE